MNKKEQNIIHGENQLKFGKLAQKNLANFEKITTFRSKKSKTISSSNVNSFNLLERIYSRNSLIKDNEKKDSQIELQDHYQINPFSLNDSKHVNEIDRENKLNNNHFVKSNSINIANNLIKNLNYPNSMNDFRFIQQAFTPSHFTPFLSLKIKQSNQNQTYNYNYKTSNLNDNSCKNSKMKSSNMKKFSQRDGDWVCLNCKNLNFSFRNNCNLCRLPKENSKKYFSNYLEKVSLYNMLNENLQNQYNNSYSKFFGK